MVYHWSLRGSKSPLVSRTLFSILIDHNSAVVWMIFIRVLISNSSSPFTYHWVTVRSTLIAIGINVTFTFHFFQLSSKVQVLISFRFLSVWHSGLLGWQSPQFGKFSIFFWLSLGLVVCLRLADPFEYQNTREDCVPHFSGGILGCAYIIFVW